MRRIFISFICVFGLCLTTNVVSADPGKRPQRGFLMGFSGAAALGSTLDENGDAAGSHTGYGMAFRIGEEAVKGLTLGLEFLGGSATANNDKYKLGFGGLLIQATWRPFTSANELQFIFGTGLGGGSISEVDESGVEGSLFGALHQLGVQYDFFLGQPNGRSWTISPTARFLIVPASGDLQSQMMTVLLGVEVTWYQGRTKQTPN